MLKVENIETYGWEAAIRGMRNPMNSWDKSDSKWMEAINTFDEDDVPVLIPSHYAIGESDRDLMRRLAKGGSVHAKFRRMLTITMDITAPLYWWKEFDTYKVGTVANSCSTMHKIHAKEFELDDFSHEHLLNDTDEETPLVFINDIFGIDDDVVDELCSYPRHRVHITCTPIDILNGLIRMVNEAREYFLETKDKRYWWQMIQLLPSSYNQRRTVLLNYEVASHIYPDRKNHKLDEWHVFCEALEMLPFSELITGKENQNDS